ncbi:hypothetical protein Amsp01_088580 [Amycolatopsis sp. NBRC 101858]|uniref:RNA polymerase sigma factor n=1 Tax=Amycolatopsis sp. NBRC 101858 TaxID=3032200 RepID=UPI00249FCB8F|nr:hypothetical protein Amsp01_088580 [Amycolatopsis sp. NBRC 101858]
MPDAVDDMPPDAVLLAALRRGDLDAGDLLYHRHAGPLRRVAAGWVTQPDEQHALIAEAFAQVFAAVRAGGGPRDHLRAYLVVAMRHLAHRWSRDRSRVQPQADITNLAPVGSADEYALRRSADQLMRAAFDSLPARWRIVLWNTAVEGRSPAELAPVLGVSPHGVAALARRAGVGLREAYRLAQGGAGRDRQGASDGSLGGIGRRLAAGAAGRDRP